MAGMKAIKASEIPALTQREFHLSEKGFRQGYWDGVLAACNEIIMGATQHDVRLWLFRELRDWVYRARHERIVELPPPCPHGRSLDESSVVIDAPKPVPAGGRCFVYAIGDGHGHTKIGIANDVGSRIRTLQTGNASRLYLICYASVPSRYDAERIESWCHCELRQERMCGEWFSVYDDCAFQTLFECLDALAIDSEVIEVETRIY